MYIMPLIDCLADSRYSINVVVCYYFDQLPTVAHYSDVTYCAFCVCESVEFSHTIHYIFTESLLFSRYVHSTVENAALNTNIFKRF